MVLSFSPACPVPGVTALGRPETGNPEWKGSLNQNADYPYATFCSQPAREKERLLGG